MINSPVVVIDCDGCGVESDPVACCALAGNCWDTRNVPAMLKRWGWTVDGERTYCEECSEQRAA